MKHTWTAIRCGGGAERNTPIIHSIWGGLNAHLHSIRGDQYHVRGILAGFKSCPKQCQRDDAAGDEASRRNKMTAFYEQFTGSATWCDDAPPRHDTEHVNTQWTGNGANTMAAFGVLAGSCLSHTVQATAPPPVTA